MNVGKDQKRMSSNTCTLSAIERQPKKSAQGHCAGQLDYDMCTSAFCNLARREDLEIRSIMHRLFGTGWGIDGQNADRLPACIEG